MNKARAMLDALMGPGRDVKIDKTKSKEKFKDDTVCKSFLIGLCPFASEHLGGKRNFEACDKIHSEIMKQQFEEHSEVENLRREYECSSMPLLQRAVRDCEGRIASEKARIRDDWGRKRPPLPVHVIDRVSQIKRDSTAMIQQAEALDDDKMQERAQMMARSEELMKESIALEEAETKKAIEAAIPEEVCEICATPYQGDTANAAHRQFKIHSAYKLVRDQLKKLEPRVEEFEKAEKTRKEEKAKENGEKADESRKEKDTGRDRSRDRERGSYRDRDRDRGRGDKDEKERDRGRDKDERDRDRGRDKDEGKDGRDRDRGKERGRRSRDGREDSRGRERRRRDESRGRGGGSGRYRSRSRDRRRGR